MSRPRRRTGKPAAPFREKTEPSAPSRWALALIYLVALCSGAAALVYEITWAKMLSLTFGSTTLAAAAVIAAFMGGMGLGARFCHVLSDRMRSPLALYACLELGIAISTALLTRMFYHLPGFFADVSHTVPPGAWLSLVRFVMVFVLLIIPSALMGATFPALCLVLIRTVQGIDRRLGMVYGINTIGGAGGVLLAGFILIERIGLIGSVNVANLVNVVLAVIAFALLGTFKGRSNARMAPPGEARIPTELPRWVTGIVLVASGFATLSYEILWFRALRYTVGNSTYALTTVLFVFLAGLGLGSLLLRRIARRGTPERDLALCQCGIALLAMVTITCQWLLLSMPGLREHVSIYSEAVRYQPWAWRLVIDGIVAVLGMLPATLLMGLSFPLATRLYLGDIRKLGVRVGGAYLLANLGSIAGAILGAVLLLPFFGTIGGTKAVAIINLAIAGFVLLWVRRRSVLTLLPAGISGAAVIVMACMLPSALTLYGEDIEGVEGDRVFVEEGDVATVQVLVKTGEPEKKAITVDGCKIGWSKAFKEIGVYRKQIMLAHLPMVLDTRIRHTLSVGLGSGTTLHTLAAYPEVETLDCVEISPGVVRASKLFEASSVLEDPRVNLVVDDAVNYLLRSPKKYDAIISDGKQDPFFSGNATLLCREYYQYAREDLNEHGLFVQWLPLGTLTADLRIILRTICEVFPYVEVFFFPRESIILVASEKPLVGRPTMDLESFRRLPIHRDLVHHFINDPASILARWTGGKPQLMQHLATTPIASWDHLQLEFSTFRATRLMWKRANFDNLQFLLAVEHSPRSPAEVTFDPGQTPYRRSSRLIREAWAASFRGRTDAARILAERAVQANPEDPDAQAVRTVMQILEQRKKERPRP